MKKIFLIILLAVMSTDYVCAELPSYAITNIEANWCDRLGDKLVWYLKAKWIAYKYQLPFLLTPFEGADYFTFYEHEQKLSIEERRNFKKIFRILEERTHTFSPRTGYLHGIDFGCKINPIKKENFEQFRTMMKPLLMPANGELPQLHKRDGVVSIAVQMRKGSGPDKGLISQQYFSNKKQKIFFEAEPHIVQEPNETNEATYRQVKGGCDGAWPLRFVPNQYYVDQLILLGKAFPNQPLDIFIFTDFANPAQISAEIEDRVNNPHMTFHYQYDHSVVGYTVARDLFLMAQCDCLIRPRSHLSHLAEFIGDHEIVIFPRNYRWNGGKLFITEVSIKLKDPAIKAIFENITANTTKRVTA
ncbi:MAG: hypothetical protein WCE21_03970 [Candidatus Babeliales bacterium]